PAVGRRTASPDSWPVLGLLVRLSRGLEESAGCLTIERESLISVTRSVTRRRPVPGGTLPSSKPCTLWKEARAMAVTIQDLRAWKSEGRRFAMLTAYDYPTAKILDEAGIPALPVGDTLAEGVLGHDTTLPVPMDAMLHHCGAAARAAKHART